MKATKKGATPAAPPASDIEAQCVDLKALVDAAMAEIAVLLRTRRSADGGNPDAAADVRMSADEEIGRKRESIRLLTQRWAALTPELVSKRREESLWAADEARASAEAIDQEIRNIERKLLDLRAKYAAHLATQEREQKRAKVLDAEAQSPVRFLDGTPAELAQQADGVDCPADRYAFAEALGRWRAGSDYAGRRYFPSHVTLAYFADDGQIAGAYATAFVDENGSPGCMGRRITREAICAPLEISNLLRDRRRDFANQLLREREDKQLHAHLRRGVA